MDLLINGLQAAVQILESRPAPPGAAPAPGDASPALPRDLPVDQYVAQPQVQAQAQATLQATDETPPRALRPAAPERRSTTLYTSHRGALAAATSSADRCGQSVNLRA